MPKAAYAILPLVGAFAGLGQAPYGIALCYLLGVLVLIRALATLPRPFLAGWLWGAGYFAHTLIWIIEPFLVEPDTFGWMAPFALILMAGGMALFAGFGAKLGAWLGRGSPVRAPFAAALGLAVSEAARAFILTGFPWVDAAQALIDTPFATLLPLGGPRLLTLALFLLIAGLALLPRLWAFAATALLGVAAMATGGHAPVAPDPDAPIVRLVQTNAPQAQKWDPVYIPEFFDRNLRMTQSDPPADLTVWPEMALPWILTSGAPELAQISAAAQGAPVVAGLPRAEGQSYRNGLIVIGPGGQITDSYDKRHLVPFGEYLPLQGLMTRVGLRGMADVFGGGFGTGEGRRIIDIPGIGKARPLICYEGVFAEEISTAQRPRLLLLLTNDAWFGQNAGPLQHLTQARLRALEQGLPLLRAANIGVPAVIDAHGVIVADLPLNTAGSVVAPLPRALPPTLYARFGEWPALILLLLAISSCLTATFAPRFAAKWRGP